MRRRRRRGLHGKEEITAMHCAEGEGRGEETVVMGEEGRQMGNKLN